ncbi:MAG TPA: hypothetical protein V6C63_01105 [Allocoleopsis sp.]
MAKAIRTVDVSNDGVTAQVPLIVDRNANNEEAIARSIVANGDLVDDTKPFPIKVISVQRTPTITRATNVGTVAAGATYVAISNIGNNNGLVLGQTLEPGLTVPFPTRIGETLSAIGYDGTGTILYIQRQS